MAYTKKMMLQVLSIMNLVGFVSLAEAMDKKDDVEKRGARSQDNYLPTAGKVLAEAEKARQPNLTAIKSDINRTKRARLEPVLFDGFSQNKPEQDKYKKEEHKKDSVLIGFGQSAHVPHRLPLKKIGSNSEDIAAKRKQQVAEKRARKAALEAERRKLQEAEKYKEINQRVTSADDYDLPVEEETRLKRRIHTKKPESNSKWTTGGSPVKKKLRTGESISIPAPEMICTESPKVTSSDSLTSSQNGWNDSTDWSFPQSPKKDEMSQAGRLEKDEMSQEGRFVLRSQNSYTPTAAANLDNAKNAGQRNLTGLTRDVKYAKEKRLTPVTIDFS